jgi:uncharacterized protein
LIQVEALRDYIARYRHKASLLARIHSRLANKNSYWDLGHTCAIVLLTGLITFLGFIGTDRILEAIGTATPAAHVAAPASAASAELTASARISSEISPLARKAKFDFWFNVGVLLLFVASLLNLIFRWKERYTAHFGGVVKLRQFIGWLDEMSLLGTASIDAGKLKHIRHQYESIVELLPPNSDRDYARAKRGMTESPAPTSTSKSSLPQEKLDDEQFILKLVRGSPATMEVLQVAARISPALWLGGGSVRTLAWNYLTGRAEDVHDYDLVYFDDQNLDAAQEKDIEAKVRAQLPRAIKISVKNQARMHAVNGEPKRSSLEDAVANWPERATATALRLDGEERLLVIAPYGYEDVLDLVVQPTPYHLINSAAFKRRLAQKDWKKHWPELDVKVPR